MNWRKYVVEKYLGKKGEDYSRFKFEIKRKIYEDLTSEDETKNLTGSKILIHLDNLHFSQDELKVVEKKYRNLPPSKTKMVRDYREDFKAGLMVMANFVKGKECKCGIYQKWIQFSPEKEIEMGFLSLENEPRINKEKYQKEFDLKCLNCGTKWQSNEIHGYHYPWNEWIRK